MFPEWSGYSGFLLSTMYNAVHSSSVLVSMFAAHLHKYSTLYLAACMQHDPSTSTAHLTLYPWCFFQSEMISNSGKSVDAQLSVLDRIT